MRIGCHVFEFDGRVKYRRPEQGGVADRPADEVVWDEKKRERLICAEGLGLSRIIWEDLGALPASAPRLGCWRIAASAPPASALCSRSTWRRTRAGCGASASAERARSGQL